MRTITQKVLRYQKYGNPQKFHIICDKMKKINVKSHVTVDNECNDNFGFELTLT